MAYTNLDPTPVSLQQSGAFPTYGASEFLQADFSGAALSAASAIQWNITRTENAK